MGQHGDQQGALLTPRLEVLLPPASPFKRGTCGSFPPSLLPVGGNFLIFWALPDIKVTPKRMHRVMPFLGDVECRRRVTAVGLGVPKGPGCPPCPS